MSDYRRHLAFKAGHAAALKGKPETANNRERGTIFFDDWADGWREGEALEVRRAMIEGAHD